jgi:pyridoxamine 5'-phosphate oxidase
MNRKNIADIRREYDSYSNKNKAGFKPLASSRYWFEQAMRALSVVNREVRYKGLTEKNAPSDPMELFQWWFDEALRAKVLDANAMTLATVAAQGKPAVRNVLLKGFDAEGFVFFTNYLSQKGRELAARPFGSLLFYWPRLMRQVRLDGKVQKVSAKESDEYFHSRPRLSQISAWASRQSSVVPDREYLEKQMQRFESKFKGKPIPRPSYWGGYRLVPGRIEFWSGRPNRLHDRLLYIRRLRGGWSRSRLSP